VLSVDADAAATSATRPESCVPISSASMRAEAPARTCGRSSAVSSASTTSSPLASSSSGPSGLLPTDAATVVTLAGSRSRNMISVYGTTTSVPVGGVACAAEPLAVPCCAPPCAGSRASRPADAGGAASTGTVRGS
jgi:hypothetical protein